MRGFLISQGDNDYAKESDWTRLDGSIAILVKHATSVLNFMDGWEIAEVEKAMESNILIPEDLSLFIEGLLVKWLGRMTTNE